MIGSIRHKGLKRLYEDGDPRGIGANLRKRVSEILSVLDAADTIEEADIPGYRLHPLKRGAPRVLEHQSDGQLARHLSF